MRMRSFFNGALSLLAASFIFMALPASAAQVDNGYQITQDVFYIPIVADDAAYFIVNEVAQVPIARGDGGTTVQSTEPMKPFSPVYALSVKTNGQSLAGYHRRC